jgi:hypothetical protein
MVAQAAQVLAHPLQAHLCNMQVAVEEQIKVAHQVVQVQAAQVVVAAVEMVRLQVLQAT